MSPAKVVWSEGYVEELERQVRRWQRCAMDAMHSRDQYERWACALQRANAVLTDIIGAQMEEKLLSPKDARVQMGYQLLVQAEAAYEPIAQVAREVVSGATQKGGQA